MTAAAVWTQKLLTSIAEALDVRASTLDLHEPFAQLGLSSLDAVQIASRLSRDYGAEISPTLFFDYPTIHALARHLATQKGDGPPATRGEGGANAERNLRIAIVGLSCRFPGAQNANEFWRNLENGIDSITDAPDDRWPQREGNTYAGGYIENVANFDHELFGITVVEAQSMDPQQRQVMELSWQALEHARYNPRELSGTRTGVFVGQSSFDYAILKRKFFSSVDVFEATGNAHSITANRLSYFYNFRGPSVAIDTACSSSLVAIHLACRSLQSGEIDLALAGGINLMLSPEASEIFTKASMLSPDSRCKTFSADANGYVRGEGGGFVVLKRETDAVRDGDRILAVVCGSGVNQDGATNGLTAPSGRAQQDLLTEVLTNAGIGVDDIGYVEAHGTGTPLGDPIEFNSLKRVFQKRSPEKILWVGSVKANIGHLEAAAGIAGVIKVVFSLQNKKIPAQLHFKSLNPEMSELGTSLKVVRKLRSWEHSPVPSAANTPEAIAGVSSFGFGGTNAHLLISEARRTSDKRVPQKFEMIVAPAWHLLCLSATSERGLKALALDYAHWIKKNPQISAGDLCRATLQQRAKFKYRLAIRGQDTSSFRERLLHYAESPRPEANSTPNNVHVGVAAKSNLKKCAFLFTGQGSQFPRMGLNLYQSNEAYRNALNTCFDFFQPAFTADLFQILAGETEEDQNKLRRTDYGQALLFSLEYALTKFWADLGITPQVVLGHSLGEIVAATVCGHLTLENACRLVIQRGRILQKSEPGLMTAVYASRELLSPLIVNDQKDIAIAAINGPELCVLSGTEHAVQSLEDTILIPEKFRFKRLAVKQAFHSPLMDPLLDEFRNSICDLPFSNGNGMTFISAVTGEKSESIPDADFWTSHVRKPVDFFKAMSTLGEENCQLHLEIGPHPTLLPMARDCLPKNQNFLAREPPAKAGGLVHSSGNGG